MSNRIDLDVAFLERQIADLVLQWPELQEDEALRQDMISGEFDAESVMQRVINHLLESEMMIDGMKSRFEDLTERKKRWERRKEFCRSLAQRVLEASGRDKITLPEATVTKVAGRDSVEIIDLDAIPQGYAKFEKKPDKTAIAASLKAGEAVPGAELRHGADTIGVRTR